MMARTSVDNIKRFKLLAASVLLPAMLLTSACAAGKDGARSAAAETPAPFAFDFTRPGTREHSRYEGSQAGEWSRKNTWPEGSQISMPEREIGPVVIIDPIELSTDAPEMPVILDPIDDPIDPVTEKPHLPVDAELPDPIPEYPSEVSEPEDDLDYNVAQPGALLRFNLQNYTILTDTAHDWYTSARPTQKGLYQIGAEYVPGEGVKFSFRKDENRADPMIFLPVYDICYNINLRDYPYFAVCYKSTATNHSGVCYFSTATNAGLDEKKNFAIDMQPSEEWTVVAAHAGKNKNWTGRLTQLRFDIASGEFSGEITVKWVGFFKSREDAKAFGVNGGFSGNGILPDKQTFDRGENITFSVTGAHKGDWVLLVQEGDACYAPSVNDDDLYVSDCMPLYWAELEDGRGNIDIDTSGGIYRGELLPAGNYDLVYMPRGRFVETARTTITITDNIVREPLRTETVYVTRGPEATDTPEPTEEPPEETYLPTATPRGRDRMTEQPTQAPVSNSAGRAGLIIALAAVACCGIALAVFFIVRRKKR